MNPAVRRGLPRLTGSNPFSEACFLVAISRRRQGGSEVNGGIIAEALTVLNVPIAIERGGRGQWREKCD